jgi:hypothetical protein
MKNHVLFIILIIFSTGVVKAQTSAPTDLTGSADTPQTRTEVAVPGSPNCFVWSDNPNGPVHCKVEETQGRSSRGETCERMLDQGRRQVVASQLQPQITAAVQGVEASQMLKNCRKLEVTARVNGEELTSSSETAISQDRRITCVKKGGYTLDWKSCKSGLDAYNMIVLADAALNMTQQFRTSQNSERMNREMAAATQEGNAQNAAYELSVEHNKKLASMNMEKVAAYTAALGLLGNKIMSWQGKSPSAMGRLCSGGAGNANIFTPAPTSESVTPLNKVQAAPGLPHVECLPTLESVKNSSDVFANDSGKAALVSAFMEYMAKAIQAGMAAKNLSNIAKQVEQVKNGTEDLGPTMFERCSVAPNDPACMQGGPRVPGQEYVGGEISIGENFNNAFGNNLEETPNVGFDNPDLTPGESVADAGNPFEDAAKEASGILDKAPAANVQPGSAPSGGGGGGGGGLGGGGVSLGNDLKGPEAEKTAEVKADGTGGKYNFAGGGGFQAIKQGKEDANPFASLFDSKSQGGVGEDRSFASDDIGGKDSGLFLRISRRYGKISGEKRIEATNLE